MTFTEIFDALKEDSYLYVVSRDIEGMLKIKLGDSDYRVLRDIVVIRSDGKEIVYNYFDSIRPFDKKCANKIEKALDDAVNLEITIQECILRILEAIAEHMDMGVFMRSHSHNMEAKRVDELFVK